MNSSNPRIAIIGAGPTGMGAAYRLHQLGYENWTLFEQQDYVGGLSASFVDEQGFTWDQGGHVAFSHFEFFDQLLEFSCKDNLLYHDRNASAYMYKRFVPYPVQNNIHFLPPDVTLSCLYGLVDQLRTNSDDPDNFADWILQTFGEGLASVFMVPYNLKVWQHPLELMGYRWIAERVSVIDLKKILKLLLFKEDDTSWGPNNKFFFPKHGGTQAIYTPVQDVIKDHLQLGMHVVAVDLKTKTIRFADGTEDSFDYLISTMPIDSFMSIIESPDVDSLALQANQLVSNTVLVVGLGINRKNDVKRCWIYFPEKKYPWYRVTYFSNYSPYNVPHEHSFSLMGEISYPAGTEPDIDAEIERSIDAYIRCGILDVQDREWIISRYAKLIPRAYPVPSKNRDEVLRPVQQFLMKHNIFSRGRFGGWKYEVANMDHSVMQGKEAVDAILYDSPETVYSY